MRWLRNGLLSKQHAAHTPIGHISLTLSETDLYQSYFYLSYFSEISKLRFLEHNYSAQWGLTVLHPNPLITLGLHDWDDNRHEIKSTEDWDESKTYHEPPVLYTVNL